MLRGLLALILLLIALFVFFVVAVLGTWAGSHITGLLSLAATCIFFALGICVVVVIWAGAYAIAPAPTKYLTVFGLVGTVLLSLLSMWIVRARESARRNGAMNNLRQIGQELQHARDIRPGVEPAFDPERLAPQRWQQP